MNTSQLEALLRRPPCPAPPGGLLAQLLADTSSVMHRGVRLDQTRQGPFWRRWIPALTFGLLFLGCLVVLGLQTSELLDLRRQNEQLLSATASPEDLGRENAQSREPDLAGTAGQSEAQRQELQKFRAEAKRLRPLAQQLQVLRAENARLRAEAAGVAAGGAALDNDPFAMQAERANAIRCVSNIKQLGLAARMWANDHGTTLLPLDFLQMRNELSTPKILTCPSDSARSPATSWENFDGSSVSYELPSATPDERDPYIVYSRCRVHGHVGLCDGSAIEGRNLAVKPVLQDGNLKFLKNANAR